MKLILILFISFPGTSNFLSLYTLLQLITQYFSLSRSFTHSLSLLFGSFPHPFLFYLFPILVYFHWSLQLWRRHFLKKSHTRQTWASLVSARNINISFLLFMQQRQCQYTLSIKSRHFKTMCLHLQDLSLLLRFK